MEKNLITPSISTIKNIWLRACGYPPGYDLFANSVINAFPHGFPQLTEEDKGNIRKKPETI